MGGPTWSPGSPTTHLWRTRELAGGDRPAEKANSIPTRQCRVSPPTGGSSVHRVNEWVSAGCAVCPTVGMSGVPDGKSD